MASLCIVRGANSKRRPDAKRSTTPREASMSMYVQVTFDREGAEGPAAMAAQKPSFKILSHHQERLIPLDGGVSFAAAVVYVLGEFARGVGEGLGKEVGKSIGGALFGGGATRDEIKAMLDFFAQYILAQVRQEFQQDRWNDAHDALAVQGGAFKEALEDPARRTPDNLLEISRGLYKGYLQLQRLGPGAFASFARMGSAMIGNEMLYAGVTNAKESYSIVLQRLELVMSDLEGALASLRTLKNARVIGPRETTMWASCMKPRDPTSLRPEWVISQLAPESYELVNVSIPGYGVVVDQVVRQFPRRDDVCRDLYGRDIEAQALAAANAFASAARSVNDIEFFDRFEAPFQAVKQQADELRARLGNKIAALG
jgi:hypothetical protein